VLVLLAAARLARRAGLETTYNGLLSGRDGIRRVAVDAVGRVTATVSQTPPVSGADLITSLDAKVQAAFERARGLGLARARSYGQPAKTAARVVLEAQTDHVVAVASYPEYNPETFIGGISAADYRELQTSTTSTPSRAA
jgi:penicillin-binding protein 2